MNISKNNSQLSNYPAGFTLVELLIMIAIIGTLSSIVTVSLNSAREKVNRVSALSSLSSVMKEMSICEIDGGGTDGYGAGSPICTDGAGVVVNDHAGALWPEITIKTGWIINALQANYIDSAYTFGATKGAESISCSVANKSCT
jgi:prepilin-type N-terminal cleavage/methylation domain-containing protein